MPRFLLSFVIAVLTYMPISAQAFTPEMATLFGKLDGFTSECLQKHNIPYAHYEAFLDKQFTAMDHVNMLCEQAQDDAATQYYITNVITLLQTDPVGKVVYQCHQDKKNYANTLAQELYADKKEDDVYAQMMQGMAENVVDDTEIGLYPADKNICYSLNE